MSSLQRVELLCACQSSVNAFFTAFLTVPLSQYQCLSLPVYRYLAQAFTALALFATFEHDGWDSNDLNQTMGICEFADKVAERFEAAIVALGLDQNESGEDHLYVMNAKKLRWMQDFYRTKILANPSADLTQQTPTTYINGGSNTADASANSEEPLNFVDEAWFSEIMGPWDYQGL